MEPVTSNEPSIRIMASDPGSCYLLKSMIARAHSRRDHDGAARLIETRDVFRRWIDDDRLRRATMPEEILEIDEKGDVHEVTGPIKEPGVKTEVEEKETSSPVLSDASPDKHNDH